MKTYLAAILGLMCAGLTGRADTVAFNSPTDLDTYFTRTGSAKFSYSSTGGLSSTPSVLIDAASTTGTLISRGVANSGGSTNPYFSASLYFQYVSPSSTAGGNMLMLGLANSNIFDPTSSSRIDAEFSINKSAFSASYYAYTGSYSGLGGNSTGSNISLVSGNWYYFAINASYNNTRGSYDVQCLLKNANSNGDVGSSVYSGSTITPASINLNTPAYIFIASEGPGGAMGVAAIDNFASTVTSVPEPSSWLALVIGLAGLSVAVRKS